MKEHEITTIIKNIAGFSTATVLNFILGFLLIPVISRIVAPDLLGYINLYITYLSGVTYFCFAGLDQAYCRFYYDRDMCSPEKLFTWCLKNSMIFTALICAVLLVGYDKFSTYMIGEVNLLFIISLCVGIISTVFLRFYNLSSRMSFKIKLFSIQAILTGVGLKILYIITAYYSKSKLGVLVGFILYFTILLLIMSFIHFRRFTFRNEEITGHKRKVILRFALPLIPSTVLSWLNMSASSIMVSKYLSLYDVGIFTNTLTIVAVVQIIRDGFANYWTPYLYQNYKEKKEDVNSIYNYIIFILFFIGLAMLLFTDIVYIIVGADYYAGKIIYPLLLIAPVITTISNISDTNSINFANKTYQLIITTAIGVLSNILLSIILMKNYQLLGAAIANAISTTIPSILSIIIGRRYYKLISSYKKTIIGMTLFTAAVILNTFFIESTAPKLVINLISLFVYFIVFRKEMVSVIVFSRSILKRRQGKSYE
jgi:O-antigen/teichoic acid export membrane protein